MSDKNVAKRETTDVERIERRRTYAPAVDIFENTEEILMYADMPGVTLDEVKINFEKNQLTMEGTCTCLKDYEKDDGFVYTRKFVVPGGIDPDRISAELRNGVLTIHLPKQDSLRPREIAVQAG